MRKIKEFVIVTADGRTFDDCGKEFENCQILDFITAETREEALRKFKRFGSYERIAVYEINRNTSI